MKGAPTFKNGPTQLGASSLLSGAKRNSRPPSQAPPRPLRRFPPVFGFRSRRQWPPGHRGWCSQGTGPRATAQTGQTVRRSGRFFRPLGQLLELWTGGGGGLLGGLRGLFCFLGGEVVGGCWGGRGVIGAGGKGGCWGGGEGRFDGRGERWQLRRGRWQTCNLGRRQTRGKNE